MMAVGDSFSMTALILFGACRHAHLFRMRLYTF
jgi:hypothetical protein